MNLNVACFLETERVRINGRKNAMDRARMKYFALPTSKRQARSSQENIKNNG